MMGIDVRSAPVGRAARGLVRIDVNFSRLFLLAIWLEPKLNKTQEHMLLRTITQLNILPPSQPHQDTHQSP